jgi:hypothetical protein
VERQVWDAASAKLVAVFNKTMPESTQAAWFVELKDFDGRHVATAVDGLCRTADRHPSLNQLIAAARESRRKEMENAPRLTYDPNELPDGAVAVVFSENYQPYAVMGYHHELPDDLRLEKVLGDPHALPPHVRAQLPQHPQQVPPVPVHTEALHV